MTDPQSSGGPDAAYHVYCDESGLHGARYTVYGGVVLLEATVADVDRDFNDWRRRHSIQSEVAWTSVSNHFYSAYKELVDEVFERTRNVRMAFKCIVFDTQDADYIEMKKRTKEAGFYTLYYQFLLAKFGEYGAKRPGGSLSVFIDERDTAYDLARLRATLNNGIAGRFGRRGVVKCVEALKSHESSLLQIADLLMGAVAFQWNGLHTRAEAKAAKRDLAAYVAKKAKLDTLAEKTTQSRQDFEIWPWLFHKPRVPLPPGARPRQAPGRPGLLPLSRPKRSPR
jgi:hypothetical protein